MIAEGTVAHEDDHLILTPDQRLTFGRSPENDLRVGATPLHDELVPRQAGAVFAVGRRIAVENTSTRLAFDVCVDGRAPHPVSPGDLFAPGEAEFEVRVSGAIVYTIVVQRNVKRTPTVVAEAVGPIRSGPATGVTTVELTPRQRAILQAYVQPMTKGSGPATHGQVAARLHLSRALVRVECNKIWSAMLLAGIPMRNLPDARDQIADAWLRHRI